MRRANFTTSCFVQHDKLATVRPHVSPKEWFCTLYSLQDLQLLELIDFLQYRIETVNCLTFVNYPKIRSLDLQADDERLGTFVNDYLLLV